MKKYIYFPLLAFASMLVVLFAGCEKAQNDAPVAIKATVEQAADNAKIKTHLIDAYGFDAKYIQETVDAFIVEGDVAFPKKDFWENYGKPTDVAGKNYRSYNLVTAVTTINVAISTNVPTTWQTAITSATAKWNALNGKIRFTTTVANYCPVNGISIYYGSLGSGTGNVIARASGFPTTSGAPGQGITINTAYTGFALSTSQRLFAGIHEIGHCIGFMHTDDASGNLGIVATTANGTNCHLMCDPYSVMQGIVGSFSSFTDCDKAAFAKLYPR